MPLQSTSGAASYDAFGGGVAAVPKYIEDYFSTFLFTGNASTQTITNGIDLSTKGGLVWTKSRSLADPAFIYDTVRGINNYLIPSSTQAAGSSTRMLTSFNNNGFTLGDNDFSNDNAGELSASWTWAKAPKFFDVVTYTGNGTVKTVNHNLGSVPGVMIVKCTSAAGENWAVYHRSLGATKYLELNNTNAASTGVGSRWDAEPTSTSFSVGYNGSVNSSGETYVAYLFAHDAGGFGLTGTDNVISCGSYTGTGATPGPVVTLGYEPQFIIWKRATGGTESWHIRDNMRGMPVTASGKDLYADLSSAEGSTTNEGAIPTATGFQIIGTNTNANASGATYIYIAIRRGPMKVPTSGTSVFSPVLAATSAPVFRASFTLDSVISMERTGGSHYWGSRLTGTGILDTTSTAAEAAYSGEKWDYQTAMGNYTSAPEYAVGQCFQRAPSFFDEVCYTGTGSGSTQITHNLQAIPELVICKSRSSAINWSIACNVGGMNYVRGLASAFGFNSTNAPNQTVDFTGVISSTYFKPTTIYGAADDANQSGITYVAYLFATCPAVSKVGTYTGNGSSQTINCGFTSGARFILIKRTDSTGDWYVWDTARGIVAGNDPHLSLNSTAAEVTTDDTIDTASSGFVVNQVAATNVNVSSATYIFLAIA